MEHRTLYRNLAAVAAEYIHKHPDSMPETIHIDVAKIADWYQNAPTETLNYIFADPTHTQAAMGYDNFCLKVCSERRGSFNTVINNRI